MVGQDSTHGGNGLYVRNPWVSCFLGDVIWLVVSTHLKNISQIGSFPQVRVKIKHIKHIWNHQPVMNLKKAPYVTLLYVYIYIYISCDHTEKHLQKITVTCCCVTMICQYSNNDEKWLLRNTIIWILLWNQEEQKTPENCVKTTNRKAYRSTNPARNSLHSNHLKNKCPCLNKLWSQEL